MLPVSLDCLRPVSCLLSAVSVSGLSSSCVLFTQCFQCVWIVFVLCLVTRHRTKTIQRHWQQWVNKTQDEDNPDTLTTLGKQDTGRRQSRHTDNTHCCQCLWIVFVLCLVYSVLSVCLDCLHPVSCLPNVVSVSGLSSSYVLFTQCCQCVWIVFVLTLTALSKQDTGRRQSRHTDNIG
jgi:hypothetical protein